MSEASLRSIALRIRGAALDSADAGTAVRRALAPAPAGLTALGKLWPVSGRLVLIAVGKAAPRMAATALEILGSRVDRGIVVAPRGARLEAPDRRLLLMESSHPLPDENGVQAARAVLALVQELTDRDLCLVLVSGGGSSLLPLPAPPLTLADKVQTTNLLLRCGADIREINTVRSHLSAIKGGRLAEQCRGSMVTLALSDVVGDPLPFIASGPTVANPTTYQDALTVLDRYGLRGSAPAPALQRLLEGAEGVIPECPKELPSRFQAGIVAGNGVALDAAAREASGAGFQPMVLTSYLGGEARDAGRFLAAVVREILAHGRPVKPPACLLMGGETTVTVHGNGTGGRNQELALSAAIELAGSFGWLIASYATDGKEGNSEAAGATASGETVERGRRSGLDPRRCLAANDSTTFLTASGDLIVTG
ncbi:MAG TPA: DUF4147 domain-containing protein, partial [Spirochaetia bacterium]|nr:DUF4147 domain-containing protein [Spirochaetia bacterium]